MADESNVNTAAAAGTRTFDELLMSGYTYLTRRFTVLSGESFTKFEVVAQDTSTDKLYFYEQGASSDHGAAFAIALEDIDATAGDATGNFLTMGVVNKNKLVMGDTGNTVDSEEMYNELRTLGIHLVDSVGA